MIAVARLASIVGIAGLLPFLIGLGALIFAPSSDIEACAVRALSVYSAGILVFLAGVYWPLGMQLERRNYPLSPVTLLILSQVFFGIAALGFLLPASAAFILYAAGYLGVLYTDRFLLREYWPDWYLRLRSWLTAVAVLSQLAAFCFIILSA